MIEISVNKATKCPFSKQLVAKIIKMAMAEANVKGGEAEVNIISKNSIKKINKEHRGADEVTDVLAFAWKEDAVLPSAYLGQMYVCYPKIVEQAREYRVSVKEEFVRVVVHGFLHIAGYDHASKAEAKMMFGLQEKIVRKIV